jgi:transcriptional regulator with XRE-family HTH domain
MLNANQLLDRAKEIHQCSDYRLAKLLEVSHSAITNYRSGRSHPDDRVAHKLATLIGLDPSEVAVWMMAERARDDVSREIWLTLARRLEGISAGALSILVGVCVTGHPDAEARNHVSEPLRAVAHQQTDSMPVYIMSTH